MSSTYTATHHGRFVGEDELPQIFRQRKCLMNSLKNRLFRGRDGVTAVIPALLSNTVDQDPRSHMPNPFSPCFAWVVNKHGPPPPQDPMVLIRWTHGCPQLGRLCHASVPQIGCLALRRTRVNLNRQNCNLSCSSVCQELLDLDPQHLLGPHKQLRFSLVTLISSVVLDRKFGWRLQLWQPSLWQTSQATFWNIIDHKYLQTHC